MDLTMRHDQLVMQAMNHLSEARELLDKLVDEQFQPNFEKFSQVVDARENVRVALTGVSIYFTELVLENLKKEQNNGTV